MNDLRALLYGFMRLFANLPLHMLHSELLKVNVVDSTSTFQPHIAAILMVPRGPEHDILFCEKDCHLQLLKKFFNVSRLVANIRDAEPEVRYNFK